MPGYKAHPELQELNCVDHIPCTYNNLLPKVTNHGAFILKTKAKKSHITNNSIKVTLSNSFKPSFSGKSVFYIMNTNY